MMEDGQLYTESGEPIAISEVPILEDEVAFGSPSSGTPEKDEGMDADLSDKIATGMSEDGSSSRSSSLFSSWPLTSVVFILMN